VRDAVLAAIVDHLVVRRERGGAEMVLSSEKMAGLDKFDTT
jgi:hypothetical protein